MTFSLLTRTERFRAAVALFGISNLASYWGEGMWGWTYGDQALAGAYPWNRRDVLVDLSPLFHADRMRTPLLLLHGEADGNVPAGESEQMFTALRILGVPAELVRFPGEDHGISGLWSNRVTHRTMMLEWFDRWLRDQPEAWEARWK
jgi:dipeptidyl aminopeptidase/acylaminoacyl peptidase